MSSLSYAIAQENIALRSQYLFNQGWLYYAGEAAADAPDSPFTPVTLPHTNKLLPYHNFDDAEYQFISTYRKRFHLPEPAAGRRVFLHFDGALLATTLTFNGHTFPEVRGGFTPFEFDITDLLQADGENVVHVSLDSRERRDIPPFGHTVDYMVFGGIYRDVSLRYVHPVYIQNVHIKAHGLLEGQPRLEFAVHIRNATASPQQVAIAASLEYWRAEFASATIEPHATEVITAYSDLREYPGLQLWSLEQPHLYNCHVHLYEGSTINAPQEQEYDAVTVRTGLRTARFQDDGFYLNGQRVKLIGLNRHQNYPYIGAAAPPRLQRRDADILKYELGVNIVRTSHYPQSPHFLNRCDEIGLLVFEEIPGWQHIGDDDWQCLVLENVRDMIQRDWNHPAIIIWGVRINESWDNSALYQETNRIAREIDPTRQTGGVRFFLGSEFLEDVYTLNDFSNGILSPEHRPHLVTEFGGHMFPTKSWDNEERRVEHALRHARVQSLAQVTNGVSGAIGWCAFDYNTHREFGSGDRICYHGVMDIFRLPKFAAWLYASQQSPAQRVVLQAATNWALGDVKEGMILPITVFSNCDAIDVYLGSSHQGRFLPDAARYRLPHPPFTIEQLDVALAHPYEDLRIVGYLGDQPVAEQIIASEQLPRRLELAADDAEIVADGADMTRLAFRITDHYGNTLPYALNVITLTLDGVGELIGTQPFPLVGGQGALYLKAGHAAGTARVTARATGLPEATVTVTIKEQAS
jgi:beta-galactosidase